MSSRFAVSGNFEIALSASSFNVSMTYPLFRCDRLSIINITLNEFFAQTVVPEHHRQNGNSIPPAARRASFAGAAQAYAFDVPPLEKLHYIRKVSFHAFEVERPSDKEQAADK
jgi:hypothetical protein